MNDLSSSVLEPVANAAADMYNGDPATDVVSTTNYHGVRFEITEGAGATGTATVTVEECTGTDGTGATAIAFRYRVKAGTAAWGAWTAATASGFTTTAGANYLYEVDVASDELSDGSPYVRLQLTEVVDSAVVGAVNARAYRARFASEPPLGALA
ncbi:MAG: hypothetical protein ACPGIJ_11925 [Mycobacterium sp.]